VADADLEAVLAHVLPAGQAALAPAAAQHRVAGGATSQPRRVDAVADGGHRATPFVADAHGELGVVLMQVGHLAGEELEISPTDPRAFDIHNDLARPGRRRRDVLDLALARPGDHEGSHGVMPSVLAPAS